MIGKIIGAFVGDKIAKQTKGVSGPAGAALGVLGTTLIRRLSIPAMVALGAGGYLAKKYMDKNDDTRPAEGQPPVTPRTVGTSNTSAAA